MTSSSSFLLSDAVFEVEKKDPSSDLFCALTLMEIFCCSSTAAAVKEKSLIIYAQNMTSN